MDRDLSPSVYTIEKTGITKDETSDFESAISSCGYGRYHYGLILLCGMVFLSSGVQNGLNAYILPSAECDLQLKSEEKGFLNVSFLTGGMTSALLWGLIADVYGRKKILVGTLLVDGVVTFVSSFSQNFYTLFIFRFLNGFIIGAPGTLVFSYLGEFHGDKQRTKSICYVGFFWTLSWMVLPGLAWIVIPMTFRFEFGGILYNSWRLYVALISIPSVCAAFLLSRYPESPKFLFSQGKSKDVLKILRKIYTSNSGNSEDDYPVKALSMDDSLGGKGEQAKRSSGGISELMKSIWNQILCLLTPPLLKYVILCSAMLFTNMFGYYGIGLWLPELFNRFETYYKLHPNTSVAVCELATATSVSGSPVAQAIHQLGNASELLVQTILPDFARKQHVDEFVCADGIDEKVFINTLTINAVCLLGNIASGYLADHLGRRTMPVTTMIISGIFGSAIYFLRSAAQNLVVACLFSMFIVSAHIVLNSVIVDIMPTHVSAMAVCLATFAGRFGAIVSNLLFGMLLDISCEIPIFLVAGVLVFGGLLGLMIPTTTIGTPKADDKEKNPV